MITSCIRLTSSITKEIIMNAANVTEQDADWYLVRSGTERELTRLATIGVQTPVDVEI